MKYVFGVEGKSTLEDMFKAHQLVCPFCKNEGDKTQVEVVQNGETHKLQECACGGRWKPKPPTKSNLEEFTNFLTNN